MRYQTAIIMILLMLPAGYGCGAARQAEIERAQAQVRRISEELDKQTAETGVYIRVEEDEIQETDPWGTQITVTYSQGGVSEIVRVRSAGPDGEFQTDDDLVAQGMTANLKGIGEGIQKNVEETAANAAKGAVKGAVEGVKESLKDSLPFGKKKSGDEEPPADKAQEDAQSDTDKPGD